MVKVKERKTEYNHGIYIRLLNRFNDLANEVLNKIDFRDLVKPLDVNAPHDIEFLYFTHRYDAGKVLEKLTEKKQGMNKLFAFTMMSRKTVEVEKENQSPTFDLPPVQKPKKIKEEEAPKNTAPIANLKISNMLKGRLLNS